MKIKYNNQNVFLAGKNIIITGATAGIGKETARSLAKMGANIIFATRNREKTQNTIAEIRDDIKNDAVILEHKLLDLIDLDSVRNFSSQLGEFKTIDVLINNAGIGAVTGVTQQGIEKNFGVNYLSHFLLTKELMPVLVKSNARIINVSSMGHMGANQNHFKLPYDGELTRAHPQRFYERSKASQIMFTRALQRRFDKHNINCTCSCLHPGAVKTDIFDSYNVAYMLLIWSLWPFMINAEEGARTSVYLTTMENPEETKGKYYYYGLFFKGIYQKPGTALVNDKELQEWLWKKSEELIGEEFNI
jgi:NAD(P)-dependent dehydrogenase (short-subunit alcohol dehydrogenase family)